jgi:hypothetical protein
MQPEDGLLIIDDSIAEKPYTDENEIICWHYDHAHDRQVKGSHFLTARYHACGQSLPVGFRLVAKTEYDRAPKDGETQRRSPVSQNEHAPALVRQAQANRLPGQEVLNDVGKVADPTGEAANQALVCVFLCFYQAGMAHPIDPSEPFCFEVSLVLVRRVRCL